MLFFRGAYFIFIIVTARDNFLKGDSMDLFEAIKKRRSIRGFCTDKPVDESAVNKILEAGIAAPSAGNEQTWHFFVVRDKETKKKLAIEAGHQKFIDEAPVVIVVCADLARAEKGYGDRGRNTYAIQDTAAAIENMLLAITALGLASCWIGAFKESVAVEILGIDNNLRPVAMLPIGVARKDVGAGPPRLGVSEVTTFK